MNTNMTPQKERLLFETYPRLFANRNKRFSPMERGMCCGDGWFELLRKLSARLEPLVVAHENLDADGAPCPRALEVREKAGELLFVMGPDTLVTKEMRDAIADAENEAIQTCELCGEPGRYKAVRGSYQTLCEIHMRKSMCGR